MQRLCRAFDSPRSVFAACWMLLFVLYLPAANAGWVSDTLGWLDAVRHQSFVHFVQRSGMGVHSFYQTTQVVTWLLYQAFGAHKWAWHILHISLQALNAALLFAIIKRVFADSALRNAASAGWITVLLFCSAPHLSEVIVWEAAFHYLQGMLFQLAVVILMLRALREWNSGEALLALFVMLLSAASLEVHYLTPVIMVFSAAVLSRCIGLGARKNQKSCPLLSASASGYRCPASSLFKVDIRHAYRAAGRCADA